jgi:long-chain fatty acid transport protein
VTKNLQIRSLAAAIGATVAVATTGPQASGFQLMEQSASGLGVAYAGMAAAAQDASTAFWNPAAMALLPGVQGTAAISYIAPHTEYNSERSTLAALGTGGDGAENATVPAMYATWMVNPQWSVGLAINAPFGLATDWNTPWAGQLSAVRSEIQTMNINPVASFRVNDMVSLGAGISAQQMTAEFTNALGATRSAAIGTVEGDDWQVGWNLGALIDFRQGTRLGITYRSSADYSLEGELTTPASSRDITADVELPDVVSIALSHQLTPQTRLLADWTWTGWDSIQNLTIRSAATGATITDTKYGFENTWRIGLGAEHQFDSSWLLRAGVAYDKTPVQDVYRTPRLPDEDRTWLAIGARYKPGQDAKWWIDVGYTHIWVDEAASDLTSPVLLIGTYESHIDIVSAQVSFQI